MGDNKEKNKWITKSRQKKFTENYLNLESINPKEIKSGLNGERLKLYELSLINRLPKNQKIQVDTLSRF